MLKEKRKIFQNDQGWRFRINKLSIRSKINIGEFIGLVLYIGKFALTQDAWFFTDTYYTRETFDYVLVEPFDEINRITSPVVALLGRITTENREIKIFPMGILKLL
jgi:hypothetical protein